VQEYAQNLYLPALRRSRKLGANKLEGAISLASFKQRLRSAWNRIHIENVQATASQQLSVRDAFDLSVVVRLEGLSPEDIHLQVYTGPLDNDGRITRGDVTTLECKEGLGDNRYRFVGAITTTTSGRFGYAIRIVPGGDMLDEVCEPGLIHWDKNAQTSTPPPVAEQAVSSH